MKIFSPRKLDELLSDPRVSASGVAKVAGLSSSGLYLVRKGKKAPRFNTVAAIAAALNKPMDYFLEDEAIVNQQRLDLEVRNVANA